MAIQMRRGALADYDKTKMLPGEIAVTTDATDEDQKIFIAFAAGDDKRILTESDLVPHTVQNIWTGTCSTSKSTATKVITLDNSEGFSLTNGTTVGVYFAVGNDADSPSLNVNSTGYKQVLIGRSGAGALVTDVTAAWGAGIHFFTYQSPYWICTSADPRAIDILSNRKANLASPTFTGTPTAPTAASGTNTTQIATTAFVQAAISGFSGVTVTDQNNDGHLVLTIGGNNG